MRRSPKKTAQQLQESITRIQVKERAHGRCECCMTEGRQPPNDGIEKHEVKTRGRGGDPTNPGNCLWVCREHHDWIHAHPEEAEAHGWLKHSWEDEDNEPAQGTDRGYEPGLWDSPRDRSSSPG